MKTLIGDVRCMSRRSILSALFSGVFSACLGFGVVIYIMQRPAITVTDVHEVDGIATRGGWLDLIFTINRHKNCEARVERWLWQPMDVGGKTVRRYVQMPAVANPPTPVGVETSYVLSLMIPGNIDPGKWAYWSRTHDGCGWASTLFGETVRESVDVPVTIINPPTGAPAIVVAPPGPVTILPSSGRP